MAVSLLTPVILTACGGSASEKTRVVRGADYRFEVPAGWKVKPKDGGRIASSDVDLAEVLIYSLVKPYSPAKFAETARELDEQAKKLAVQLPQGKLVESGNATVGGRKVRSYRVDFSPNRTEEFAFVLDDRTEYFLLCRRLTDGSTADCEHFFASFALNAT